MPASKDAVHGFYAMSGYRAAGARAIRIDMLERLADMLRDKDSRGGFEANADMLSITGMTLEQFADLMAGLGYKAEKSEREKVKILKPEIVQDTKVTEEKTEVGQSVETVESVVLVVPEIDVFYTFTWAGRAARESARPKRENAKPMKGKSKRPAKGGDDRKRFAAKPKVEKQIDPDNPFAAALAGFNKS